MWGRHSCLPSIAMIMADRNVCPTFMQLAILTAVLAAIASADGGSGAVAGVAWRLLVVASAAVVAPLTAFVGSQRLVLNGAGARESEDAIWKLQTFVAAVWLVGVALILLVAEWPRI